MLYIFVRRLENTIAGLDLVQWCVFGARGLIVNFSI